MAAPPTSPVAPDEYSQEWFKALADKGEDSDGDSKSSNASTSSGSRSTSTTSSSTSSYKIGRGRAPRAGWGPLDTSPGQESRAAGIHTLPEAEEVDLLFGRTSEPTVDDVGNISALEHINIDVSDRGLAEAFYVELLQLTRDPHKATTRTMWMNCGRQQIHLPTGPESQAIRGWFCMCVPFQRLTTLNRLLSDPGLVGALKPFAGTKLAWSMDVDGVQHSYESVDDWIEECSGGRPARADDGYETSSSDEGKGPVLAPIRRKQMGKKMPAFPFIDSWRDQIAIRCPWGNLFLLYNLTRDNPVCPIGGMGINHLVQQCGPNQVAGIAKFYAHYLSATVRPTTQGGCAISVGCQQWMIFTPTAPHSIKAYDGHHIAIYVNQFSRTFELLKQDDLIWVNPRFSDKATTLQSALVLHQFRFKSLVDPGTKAEVYELEHEVRSARHPAFFRTLVNRNTSEEHEYGAFSLP